jgi:hypothetical protein
MTIAIRIFRHCSKMVWVLNMLVSVILIRQHAWQLSIRRPQVGVNLINNVLLTVMLNTTGA